MTDLRINLQKTIDAPINNVFDAWLDAKTMSKFMMPMNEMPEPRVEADGVQDGRFTVFMMVGDDEIPHSGTYLEVDRPNKLVFSWESPFSTDGSTVTLNLQAKGDNQTVVELTHVKFIDEQARANHEGGWSTILDRLEQISAAAQQVKAAV